MRHKRRHLDPTGRDSVRTHRVGKQSLHLRQMICRICRPGNAWAAVPCGSKASGTQGCSRTVPQFSTDRALRRLTSEFGRDPVYSARYGRQRTVWVKVRRDLYLANQSEKNEKENSPPDTLRHRGGYFPISLYQ